MSERPSVVYMLPDKMGGMTNVISHLLEYHEPDGFSRHAVLTHNHLSTDTRFGQTLRCDSQTTVEYSLPLENLHAVMRRVARAIPRGRGVVLPADLLELATLSVYDVGRAVILILHGDNEYYEELAVKHDRVVHAYVAISRRIHEQLLARLPHRANDIYYMPFGIPLPERRRMPSPGPLRLIFAGRLEHGQKGVLELPAIDARLRDRRVDVTWTIIGDGPHAGALRASWPESARVHYRGACTQSATVAAFAEHDVFVLPTRHEGLPVALLEAMGAGVVPVVSNIESGVPDVVTSDVTGFLPEVGNLDGFASAIARLAADRERLEHMGARGRACVADRFDVRLRVRDYQALYARYEALYCPLPSHALQYGSRLDQWWLPNPLVRLVRSTLRARLR